jgi:phosphotransferase system  glucose/maltose/N-acetylglucosamine-specific IIC component
MPSFLVGLFERPLVPVLLLGLAAAALAWAAVSRDDRRFLTAAIALGGVAALLASLAWFVSTPGERAEALVDRFVEAAERADL